MEKYGLLVTLEANQGKEADVEDFLRSGLPLVQEEPGTDGWYAFKFGKGKYGIFDTFSDEDGRHAHLTGKVTEALKNQAEGLFSKEPVIQKIDLLAIK